MWLFAALVACGDNYACPEGTVPAYVSRGKLSGRVCWTADGKTLHGPVVEIDERGVERLVGKFSNGKKEGRWVSRHDGFVGEITYRAGQAEGRSTLWAPGGALLTEEYWEGGLAAGRHVQHGRPGDTTEKFFRAGRRTGTWRRTRQGEVIESRMYSAPDLLHAVDGRVLPVARERIELSDGSVLVRGECEREPAPSTSSSCLDLFEAYQRCGIDAHEPDCQKRAVEAYRTGRLDSF